MGRKKKFLDVMLDIETVDSVASAAIVQVGAVLFNRKGGVSLNSNFKRNVSIDSNLKLNRTISESTLLWWFDREPEARKSVFNTKPILPLPQVLKDFSAWFQSHEKEADGKLHIWCKGAKFDFSIMSDAYRTAGLDVPWFYRNENCLRTLLNRYPELSKKHKFTGVAHDAIDDCLNQIKQLQAIYKFDPKLA